MIFMGYAMKKNQYATYLVNLDSTNDFGPSGPMNPAQTSKTATLPVAAQTSWRFRGRSFESDLFFPETQTGGFNI